MPLTSSPLDTLLRRSARFLAMTMALATAMVACSGGGPGPLGFLPDASDILTPPDAAVGGDSGGPNTDGGGRDAGGDSSVVRDSGPDATADAAVDAGGLLIQVNDPSVTEGSSGPTSLTFTVTLTAPSSKTVTVAYATADGTATSFSGAVGGADYVGTSGTLVFNPGDTTKSVTVTVNGDTTAEANETFYLNLSNPVNAKLAQPAGAGAIVNDDTAPQVSIGNAVVIEGNSGVTQLSFAVSLDAPSGQTVSVPYTTTNGTAAAGSDYQATSGTLTFLPGQTSKSIVVVANGDTAVEANETFTVDLSSPTNATLANASGTGTIQNDDGAAIPTLSVGDVSVTEGASGLKAMTFTVTLSATSAQTITVDYATNNGTATVAATDYQATSGVLVFDPGNTSKTVTVLIVGDTANETDETFTLDLANSLNANLLDAQAVGTILNDDGVPSLTIADATVAEGQAGTTNLTFTVTLSAAAGQTVTVAYATTDGSATSGGTLSSGGQDYTPASGTLSFAPGVTSMQFTVPVAGDLLNEANETLTATLSAPVNATLGGKITAVGTLTNDDPLPLVSVDSVSVNEGTATAASLVFTVSLTDIAANPAPAGRTVSVNYATQAVSATAGGDYVTATGTLTFAAGETQKTFSVQTVPDSTAEPNETFNVVLSAPLNATLSGSTGVGTIVNDDGALPFINIGDAVVSEGTGGTTTLSFTVSLSAVAGSAVTVSYATQDGTAVAGGAADSGGQDYVATSGTVTFAAGETSKTVSVTVNSDATDEADTEAFSVVLSNPSPAGSAVIQDGVGSGTINDDDAQPTVSIAAATTAEGASGSKALSFTVTLSAKSGRPVSVSYSATDGTASSQAGALGGADYALASGTVSFAAGETSKTVNATVYGDTMREGDETFSVTLASPANVTLGPATATGTITNDDGVPTVNIADLSQAEGTVTNGTTPFNFTVSLSNATTATVTVLVSTADGTATTQGNPNLRDYTPLTSVTVTFQPGETTKQVAVQVKADANAEGSETFAVNLSGPTNATLGDGAAVGTITNDD